MNRYEIRCTELQTRKAFALGAPIETSPMIDLLRNEIGNSCLLIGSNVYWFPTAEQLIGWLEEQGVWIHFCRPNQRPTLLSFSIYDINKPFRSGFIGGEFNTRKEATIAAIDAALECLEKQKGGKK